MFLSAPTSFPKNKSCIHARGINSFLLDVYQGKGSVHETHRLCRPYGLSFVATRVVWNDFMRDRGIDKTFRETFRQRDR